MPRTSDLIASSRHVELYGQVRKVLLSRYFALGRYDRNDFFQESTELEGRPDGLWSSSAVTSWRDGLLTQPFQKRTAFLWQKRPADRDNPWLFGCKLSIAIATEARLGVSGADALLGRIIRSCEQLFKFNSGAFRGFPLRYDPVTCDHWLQNPEDSSSMVSRDFLVARDGSDYLYSTPPNDPRHCPQFGEGLGVELMGRRLYLRYLDLRYRHLEHYRKWEPSQDEMVGVLTTYIAAAEGTKDAKVRRIARQRLRRIAEYFAEHAYLMVLPRGGLSARGAGDALPALEWPVTQAITRATGGEDLGLTTASFQEGLQRAGLWDVCRQNTELAVAAAWVNGIFNPALLLTVETILAIWSVTSWTPKFLNPGNMGFAAGIWQSSAAFDVWNARVGEYPGDSDSAGIALAALLHSWQPQVRFNNYIDYSANYGGSRRPFSSGFVPFLGFMAVGGDDATTANGFHFWLEKRRDRKVDTDSVEHYSATLFASIVELLLSQGRNVGEEARFLDKLSDRYMMLATGVERPIVTQHDIFAAVDYLAAVALAWRYRQDREAAGSALPAGWPQSPTRTHKWPEPAVPRLVVESMPSFVPVQGIQGQAPPRYDGAGNAPLFLDGSPSRPAVRKPSVTFDAGADMALEDMTFTVAPGPELFTGIALQWGDEWEIAADGTVTIGGAIFGPEGGEDSVHDARYPVHSGRDPNGTDNCLIARLNNYVVVGRRRRKERWLYPEETFLYLRINQATPSGEGGFRARVRVRGSRRPLRRLLLVGCVVPDSSDPDRRIDAIGGVHRDGSRWLLPIDQAIASWEGGTVFYTRPSGHPAVEVVPRSRKGKSYLATISDDGAENNLSFDSFPRCP